MKRTLTAVLGLLALVIAGLLLLATNRSFGSEQVSLTMTSSLGGSPPPVAATLSYSEFLTLAATDIWSLPTPIHTPIIPTERPSLPRPTPGPVTPHPTPTFLPNQGVRLEEVREVEVTPNSSLLLTMLPRLIFPNTDGEILTGVVEKEDVNVVVAIDLGTGEMRVLWEGEEWPREPEISQRYVVWSTLHQLHFYDLESAQLEHLDFGVARQARVSGEIMVWTRNSVDIWGYNLRTGEDFPVAAQPDVMEYAPAISGQWVVYLAWAERVELRGRNILTQQETRIGEIPLRRSEEAYLESLYAVSTPWVAWGTEAALHFYNLETNTTYSVPVEACSSPMNRPEDLALSGNVLIFTCDQWLGYDIERDVFFSVPVYRADIPNAGFDGWDISGDWVVWVLTEDAYGAEERGHIYTAQIERSP